MVSVARSLLEFAVDDGAGNLKVREKISRQDLAKMVGASREMVSRVMKDLEERGFIEVDSQMRTNVPHIYAIGDIVSYSGKKRLILCAFHEATMAAFAAAEYLQGSKPLLEYTTTSARLHAILGVSH